MTFEEIENQKLSAQDKQTLVLFSKSKEWRLLQEVVESSVLLWAHNLLKADDASAYVEVLKKKGFRDGWVAIKKLINNE